MKFLKLNGTRLTSRFAAISVLALGALGCAEGNDADSQSAALTASGWTWCAVQGGHCNFEGTHQVQFGAGPQFVTRTFSNGVHCGNGDFEVKFGEGNACYVLLGEEASAHVHEPASDTTIGAPSADTAVHTHDGTVTAAQPSAVPQPSVDSTAHLHDTTSSLTTPAPTTSVPADTSTGLTHDHIATTATTTTTATTPAATTAVASDPAHVHDTTAAAVPGPYINKALIPQGSPGIGVLEVRPTTERPLANNDVGAFRTSCAMSHMNNDDPIVFPGQTGKAHLHTYFGNTGANANSTADSLHNTGNSTCRGGIANRSAYWVPAVVTKDGTPLKPRSAQVYYKTGYNGIAPRDVKVFPQGLRMIAGDAKMAAPGQEHAFWSCEVYNGHPNAIPDCPAGQAVIMQVFFPQCWNGKDLDSSDHKSHMAYPVNGACPATHPVAIPEISFNIYYDVPAGSRSSEWHLSSDMYDQSKPGGYSAHGDWFEGWDRDIAEAFVKNCDNTQSDCHSHLLGDGREIYSSLEGV